MPARLSKPPPETRSDAASRYRGASVWMIAQGWCPTHNSGGTERMATSGTTARSTQPRGNGWVSGERDPGAPLLPERRPAFSLWPRNRTLDYLGTLLCTLSSSIRHGALERYKPDKARHETPSSLCRRKSRGLRSFEKAPFMWFVEQG